MRRWVTRAAQAAGLLLLVAALWRGWLEVTGNFHEVRAGLLYRSAQLSPERLDREITAHGIRSVLNLRGADPAAGWWRGEVAVVTPTLRWLEVAIAPLPGKPGLLTAQLVDVTARRVGGEGLRHQLLVVPRVARVEVIGIGGVDQRDAGVEGGVDRGDRALAAGTSPYRHRHGSQADGADPHVADGALLHGHHPHPETSTTHSRGSPASRCCTCRRTRDSTRSA